MDTKTGDILATIRKSVDDDIDAIALPSTASQSRGTLLRGVLREMRVTMNADPNPAQAVREEIETLRERIKRKGEATSLLSKPAAPTPVPAAVEKPVRPALTEASAAKARGEFSGILSGRAPEPPKPVHQPLHRPQPSPVLRPTIAEDDHFGGSYHAPQARRWFEEEQGYQDGYQEQAYEPAPSQHYHDRAAEMGAQNYPVVPQPPLLSGHAEAATEAAFRHLSDSLLARATGDRGLEDMTREMLRGMIKQWLDANLPQLVEELVREEIERVARKGR